MATAEIHLSLSKTESKWSPEELAKIAQTPDDLQKYLLEKESRDLIPAYEEPPPVLLSEIIHPSSCKMTAFFPVSLDGKTKFPRPAGSPMIVVIIIPGGQVQ